MESTARDRTTEPAAAIGPRLEVVAGLEPSPSPTPGPGESSNPDEPSVWRNAAVGAVAGFLFVTLGVTAAGVAGGIGVGGAIGIGTFVGLWGGVGFGFMMGATVPLARHLDATHRRRPVHHGQGENE